MGVSVCFVVYVLCRIDKVCALSYTCVLVAVGLCVCLSSVFVYVDACRWVCVGMV